MLLDIRNKNQWSSIKNRDRAQTTVLHIPLRIYCELVKKVKPTFNIIKTTLE